MSTSNERPSFAVMASDVKRFVGLRLDIRELINLSRPPSIVESKPNRLHHPVLAKLHQELLFEHKRGEL